MEWWQILITVGSVLSAVGVSYKFATDWGGRIARFIVKVGSKEGSAALNKRMADLEQVIEDNTKILKSIKDELDANTRLTLKLELKSLFRNHPECTQVIELTMDKYKSLGGDSYIDNLYDEWKEKYERPKFCKAMGSGESTTTKTTKKKTTTRKKK